MIFNLRALGLTIAVGLLLYTGVYGQGSANRLSLSGTISGASSAQGISNVEIFVSETGNRTFSDEDGSWLVYLPKGAYTIHFYHMAFESLEKAIQLSKDTTLTIGLAPKPFEIKTVLVRSSMDQKTTSKSTMNTKVLDKEFLERNYHSTFSQGLEKIPGINSITTGVGIAKPVIRGFTGNRITVNDHGIRQEGQQWGSDHGLEIDPYLVDRIEVIRGAASIIYGSDAMGGVINIVEPLVLPKGRIESSVLGVYRGNNDHFGTSVSVSARPSDWHFSGRVTLQSYGDYRVPASDFVYNSFELPIENERLKNTAGIERHLAGSVGRIFSRGSVRLSVSNYHQRTGLFPGAVGIPRSFALIDDGDARNTDIPRQEVDHFKAILNSKIHLGKGRLETDLGLQRNNRQELSFPHAHGQAPQPVGNLAHGLLLYTGTLNSRYHRSFDEKWSSTFGLSAQVQSNERKGFEFLLGDYTSLQTGVFAHAEFSPSETMTYSIGLRQDFALVDIESHFMPVYASPEEIIGETQRGPEVNRFFAQPSGAVGISWNPSSVWNLKANLGRSFRYPSPPELGVNGIHHGTFRHEMGDPNLNPEQGWQLDLGLYRNTENFSFSLLPYANFFENFIFLRPTAQFSPLPEAGQMFVYTEASAFHTGAEFQAVWRAHRRFEIESSLEYTYNYNLDNSLPIPFTPPLLNRTELTYYLRRAEDQNIYFFAEAVFAAAQNLTDLNEPPTPGYQIFNAGVQVSHSMEKYAVHFQFMVRNIGDTFYLNHLSRYRLLNLPEPGRNFMVSLRLSRKADD